jgi:hypothetical protein
MKNQLQRRDYRIITDKKEDLLMFKRLWPKQFAKFISRMYAKSYLSNAVKKINSKV